MDYIHKLIKYLLNNKMIVRQVAWILSHPIDTALMKILLLDKKVYAHPYLQILSPWTIKILERFPCNIYKIKEINIMQILLQILAYNNLLVIVFCTLYTFHQSLFTVSYKSLTQFSQNSSQTQNDFKLQYNSICIVQEGISFNLIKNRPC